MGGGKGVAVGGIGVNVAMGVAVAVLAHVPTRPGRLHCINGAVQAVSQHTLTTQKVDAHCSAAAQLDPMGRRLGVAVGVRGVAVGALVGVAVGIAVGIGVLVGVGVGVGLGVAVGVAVGVLVGTGVGVLVGVAVGMGVGVGVGVGVGAERQRGLILGSQQKVWNGSHRSPLPLPQNRPVSSHAVLNWPQLPVTQT